MTIRFFSKSDTYREFSNFAPFPIDIDGTRWPSTEHYYQAQKFDDPDLQERIRAAKKPVVAKKLADKHRARIRGDWDQVKDAVMERAIRAKFTQHEPLRALLLGTAAETLQEAAPSDYYWGVGSDGTGRNKLGQILMRLRAELRGAATAAVREAPLFPWLGPLAPFVEFGTEGYPRPMRRRLADRQRHGADDRRLLGDLRGRLRLLGRAGLHVPDPRQPPAHGVRACWCRSPTASTTSPQRCWSPLPSSSRCSSSCASSAATPAFSSTTSSPRLSPSPSTTASALPLCVSVIVVALALLSRHLVPLPAGECPHRRRPRSPEQSLYLLRRDLVLASSRSSWLAPSPWPTVPAPKPTRLLANILPAAIAERLKARPGERVADSVAEASVLFSDLVGFTELAQELGAARTVAILDQVVTEFDRLAAAHGVEKIKTIGDGYMAVAGVSRPQADHLPRLARMALRPARSRGAALRDPWRRLARSHRHRRTGRSWPASSAPTNSPMTSGARR